MNAKGFTFIELFIGFFIVGLVAVLMTPALRVFERQKSLDSSLQGIIGQLRIAQSKTLASENSSSYGVYFDTMSNPHSYILFKGASFEARDVPQDITYELPGTIELFNVTVPASQVVFQRLTGQTAEAGEVSLRLKADASQTRSIFVDSSGTAEASQQAAVSDQDRIKDSRHAHIDYANRQIQISESIVITFPNGGSPVLQSILISSNMQSGQVFWEGIVMVAGQAQTLQILTHSFNDPAEGTQFSIRRDKRYNTKGLSISLTGDATGTIIQYDAQGQTSQGTSLYVSEPALQ
ncbi:MAG: hypothetical protein HYS60_01870 [Candidatus Wildermuthbacteria bacterium]|nr:hypothetical protein [Candidatus Wildermuthbacteria bacterium]